MKEFIKKNWKALIALLCIVILFPVLILTPSPWGVIPRDIGLAIVGYGGAIIGGFLTLYGVWITIEDNKKVKQRELELQYCPILLAEAVPRAERDQMLCSKIIIKHQHNGFNDAKPSYANQMIRLSNVGRGEIKQIVIKGIECTLKGTNNDSLTKELHSSGLLAAHDDTINFIPIGGSIDLLLGLASIRGEFWEELNQYYYSTISVSIDFSLEGVFTSENQEYKLSFGIATTCVKNDRKHDLYDISLTKK